MQGLTMSAQATVTSNFAYQHLTSAIKFRDLSSELEKRYRNKEFSGFFSEIRSYVSGTILTATASLEALINELYIHPRGQLYLQFSNFEQEFWGRNGVERKPILWKYQKALQMLGEDILDVNSEIYSNARDLIMLRNYFVHFKPTYESTPQSQQNLSSNLSGKFATSPFVDSGADFFAMKCMSSSCAQWTVSVVQALVNEFFARTNIEEKKIKAFLAL
jgi:hypothetical protein